MFTGAPLPLDLASVLFLPSRRRQVSFLSIALGLMVDVDIGTENMRWIGDTRFVLGFIKGVVASKNFKCRLKLKVLESDKVEMARKARESAKEDHRVIGAGTDPLAGLSNRVKGMHLEDAGAGPSASADGEGSKQDAESHILDDGPLGPAEALQPDDTWETIDSTSRGPSSNAASIAHVRADGAWRDGQGILYV